MNTARKAAATAAVLGASILGGALGANLLGTASAQTPTTAAPTTQAPPSQAPASQDPASQDPALPATPAGRNGQRPPRDTASDPSKDPRTGGHQANGKTEELLTGDTATKVTDAAKAAVPDGTIERVETDAEGATYEAHMTKADGSHVTVTFNADFSVAQIQSGH